jgi:protein-disulfide isomerase
MIETATTAILTFCAVAVTAMTVRDHLRGPAPQSGELAAVSQKNWRHYAVSDMRIGSLAAPVTITEFSDFQCPVCGRLYRALEKIRARYGDSVTIVYRNYPLNELHPAARSAAAAAECAAQQGQFENYYKALFERQDTLDRVNWSAIARRVGVIDTNAFSLCLTTATVATKLKTDSLAATSLGIPGTPLVLVNEWMYRGAPTQATLDSVISHELAKSRR